MYAHVTLGVIGPLNVAIREIPEVHNNSVRYSGITIERCETPAIKRESARRSRRKRRRFPKRSNLHIVSSRRRQADSREDDLRDRVFARDRERHENHKQHEEERK